MGPDLDAQWREASDEIIAGMTDWRVQHPRATLREIEAALDERLARLRAKMLTDLAQHSPAADWRTVEPAAKEKCPRCGHRLQVGGAHQRRLQTHGGQEIVLNRQYGVCPQCGESLFPPG